METATAVVQQVLDRDLGEGDRQFPLRAVLFRYYVSYPQAGSLAWDVRLLHVRRGLHGG